MEQATTALFPRTIGMDLGTKKSAFTVLSPAGRRLQEGGVPTRRKEMHDFLAVQERSRVVIEASGPSRWIAELARSLGHEVVVANPREFRLIAESHRKSDRNDARILAEFGQIRPRVLHPIHLRGLRCQVARGTLDTRSLLVEQRTELINRIRAQVRNLGECLPSCSTCLFHRKMATQIPDVLRVSVDPLFDVLETIGRSIAALDAEIERTIKEEFPEAQLLLQVPRSRSYHRTRICRDDRGSKAFLEVARRGALRRPGAQEPQFGQGRSPASYQQTRRRDAPSPLGELGHFHHRTARQRLGPQAIR